MMLQALTFTMVIFWKYLVLSQFSDTERVVAFTTERGNPQKTGFSLIHKLNKFIVYRLVRTCPWPWYKLIAL